MTHDLILRTPVRVPIDPAWSAAAQFSETVEIFGVGVCGGGYCFMFYDEGDYPVVHTNLGAFTTADLSSVVLRYSYAQRRAHPERQYTTTQLHGQDWMVEL